MTNILIVDDNKKIRKLIEIYLAREGFKVFQADDGEVALDILDEVKIDLIIADIMMPNMDGYELVEELRGAKYNLPILMVTAKNTYPDKKMGFELGADDYMTKPIDMDELILRVKALLRRSKISIDKHISIGDIIIDYEALEVRTTTDTILLPMKEFYLLYKLLSYPNKIFTRQQLMDDIWGFDSEADERTVDVHIKRIREKFKDIDEFQIVTVRGLGYKGVHK
ncbi:response regulator transcription factor [Tissierella sp. MB52-C2]|uniref:response regulator transcription factor n=1 Tax=Tissierella sp. MB52-C2 TaxID=3070999 RepID=UPI00280B0206|nr:response regulator transcription factor [Tissierella sp. MB52-C2]WMM26257.1 response regulator transcription factor [Tissierella sp. MB52-C2]